tara:strand:+ start:18622 stop:19161 length:540 start_codon:yes stop_codon:yes gene_type:complete
MPNKALFLDRDGTIIIDTDYPNDPKMVAFVPGTIEALREIQREYKLIVVSNQSGVGRGLITQEQFEAVHKQFVKMLESVNIEMTGIYYCLHAPEEKCDCRKPSPKMILDAAEKHHIELSSSYMIGDKMSDVIAGKRAGCNTILITPENHTIGTDSEKKYVGLTASDLHQAVNQIINLKG